MFAEAMEYTQLGRTGLKVGRIVLGTMNFGTDEAGSHALMDTALDAGINFFDTADIYGTDERKGRTEEILGSWFARGGGRRDKVVLATKVYGNVTNDGKQWHEQSWPNHDRLSALNIRRAVDASLKRLGTDHIDIYQFHHIDRATPWEEIWQAVDVLVRQGKILYAASSNFAGWHLAQANEAARPRRPPRPGQRAVPLQPRRAARRDGRHPGGAGVRPRRHPLVAAAPGAARRRAAQGTRRRRGAHVGRAVRRGLADPVGPGEGPGVRGPVAKHGLGPVRSRWRGCSPGPG